MSFRETAGDDCTCRITGPSYDETHFDDACPYHGKDGSMVAVVPLSQPSSRRAVGQAVKALDGHDYASLGREVRRLATERDRYRHALQQIRGHGVNPDDQGPSAYSMREIASRALEGKS